MRSIASTVESGGLWLCGQAVGERAAAVGSPSLSLQHLRDQAAARTITARTLVTTCRSRCWGLVRYAAALCDAPAAIKPGLPTANSIRTVMPNAGPRAALPAGAVKRKTKAGGKKKGEGATHWLQCNTLACTLPNAAVHAKCCSCILCGCLDDSKAGKSSQNKDRRYSEDYSSGDEGGSASESDVEDAEDYKRGERCFEGHNFAANHHGQACAAHNIMTAVLGTSATAHAAHSAHTHVRWRPCHS